jgi:hypothetical protein
MGQFGKEHSELLWQLLKTSYLRTNKSPKTDDENDGGNGERDQGEGRRMLWRWTKLAGYNYGLRIISWHKLHATGRIYMRPAPFPAIIVHSYAIRVISFPVSLDSGAAVISFIE